MGQDQDEPDTLSAGESAAAATVRGGLEKLGTPADERVGELIAAPDGAWWQASQAERLAVLDAAAGEYLQAERPAHTRRAYAADWRAWEDYTVELGIPLYAASIGSLVGFVRWLEVARGYAPATVDRRLAGAVAGLKQAGVRVPDATSRAAWEAVTRYKERAADADVPAGRGRARPLTTEHMFQLIAACPDTLAGLRDRALLLIGWTIGARDAELSRLRARDLVPDADGYVVEIPVTKTGLVDEPPVLPRRDDQRELCAVRAWETWRDAAEITTGPALRRVNRYDQPHPQLGLSPQAVGALVTKTGQRAGLPFRITGHSLRHGMATSARLGGADLTAIARQGRWSPTGRAVHGYVRQVDRHKDNAALHLGRPGRAADS